MDRYVAVTFLSSWLVAAVFFVGLLGVFDFFSRVDEVIQHMGDYEGVGGGLSLIGTFYLYQVPSDMLQVAPFIMLLSALVTVTRLQRHNEFMAMLLTGRSAQRVIAPVFVLTAMFIGVMVYVQEVISPRVAEARLELESKLRHADSLVIDTIDLVDADRRQFRARNFHVEEQRIEKLYVSFEDGLGRNVHIEGEDATYDESAGGWLLKNGTSGVTEAGSTGPPVVEEAAFALTDVRPAYLLDDYLEPFDLSYRQVLMRSERYPKARSYRLLRHYHVTYPLSIMLLVLLGVPFALRRQERHRWTGMGVSVGLCLAFMLLDATVRDLGNRGMISPVLAAWMPVIVAGSLVFVLLDSGEDRPRGALPRAGGSV